MNNVVLMGRLVRDPQVRYSNNGTSNPLAIARYTLAVDRKYAVGRTAEQTADFINIVSFGKAGEFVEKYLRQGTKIAIVGRIQTSNYTNQEGKKVYVTEVVTTDIEFAESKKTAQNENNVNNSNSADNDGFMNIPDGFDDDLPFA